MFTYIGLSALITFVSKRIIDNEQRLKIKFNEGICSSDLKLTQSVVTKLITYALIGGLISGSLGLGGGSIYNPVMLSMGVPPSVSSSTAMYMVMFTGFGSSLTYLLY